MGLYRALYKEHHVREYTDQELFKRYIKRIFPYKKSVFLISIFILTSTLADILIPLIFGITVRELEQINTDFWLIIIAGFVYCVLSKICFYNSF